MSESRAKDAAGGMPEAISGIDAMRGVGAVAAKGFWADAWDRVLGRFGARVALLWIGIVAFFAVFGPVIANAHPIWRRNLETGAWDSPLWQNLTSVDLALLAAAVIGLPFAFLPLGAANRIGMPERWSRLGLCRAQTSLCELAPSARRPQSVGETEREGGETAAREK